MPLSASARAFKLLHALSSHVAVKRYNMVHASHLKAAAAAPRVRRQRGHRVAYGRGGPGMVEHAQLSRNGRHVGDTWLSLGLHTKGSED